MTKKDETLTVTDIDGKSTISDHKTSDDKAESVSKSESDVAATADEIKLSAEQEALMTKMVEDEVNKAKDAFKKQLDVLARDKSNVLKENKDLRQAKIDAEVKAYEEAGKPLESLQVKYDGLVSNFEEYKVEKEQELNNAHGQIATFARDHVIDSEISHAGLEFSSPKARLQMKNDISSNLVKKDDTAGSEWIGKNGENIADIVKEYTANEDNNYLFASKENVGTSKTSSMVNGKTNSTGLKHIEVNAADQAAAVWSGPFG